MKKEYSAPLVKYLAFSVEETIAQTTTGNSGGWSDQEEMPGVNSKPWNDGELGWT